MIYINKDDIIEVIQEKLLDDSLQLNEKILDGLEKKTIAFAVSYISGRYDTSEIFGGDWWADNATNDVPVGEVKRHPVLIQAIAMIMTYRAVRRNAARKVPDDFPDIYKESLKILENIQKGSQTLDGLPKIGTDGGNSTARLMYGNTTKDEYFL